MAARRTPKTETQRKHEGERNATAMARVFGGLEATREDCVRVQSMLQKICKIDENGPAAIDGFLDLMRRDGLSGLVGPDGLVGLVRLDAIQSVYREIMDGITKGRLLIEEGGLDTVSDSGGEG